MVCPNCRQEVNDANTICPFCSQPLKEEITEGGDFYNSFEIKETVREPNTIDTKGYVPKKATEGLAFKIVVGALVLVVGIFVYLYLSSSHLFCSSNNGGKFGVFYTKNRIIYCFQSGQGPGDCKAIKSMTKSDLEQLGYHDYESFMQSIKIDIEKTGIGNCQ
jgi:hypothetical protein